MLIRVAFLQRNPSQKSVKKLLPDFSNKILDLQKVKYTFKRLLLFNSFI